MNSQEKKRVSLASTRNSNSLKDIENHNEFEEKPHYNKICRICLEECSLAPATNENFIKACKCSGSMEYMHEVCLMEWINTMVKKKIELGQPTDNMTCEICQETLDLEKKTRYVCRTKADIKSRIREYWIFFSICAGMSFFILCGMGAIGYIHATEVNDESPEGYKTGIIVAWIVCILFLIFWVFRIVWNYVIGEEEYVSKVKPKVVNSQMNQIVLTQSRKGEISKEIIHIQKPMNNSENESKRVSWSENNESAQVLYRDSLNDFGRRRSKILTGNVERV